jgi:uncharacterized membrane protein YebE (DUF533 family)
MELPVTAAVLIVLEGRTAVLNNPADVLSVVLRGTLGRSGRKRARRAASFLTGHRGFLSASTMIAAAGVAWGIYDTIKGQNQGAVVAGVPGVPQVPLGQVPPLPTVPGSVPGAFEAALDPIARVIRLAVSAAKADGQLSDQEKALIMDRAREAGLASVVEAELTQTRSLADIVRGVTDQTMKNELYVLAFTIIRADESVSGAERIYLAQLAHQLGLDPAAVQTLENETANKIDSQSE